MNCTEGALTKLISIYNACLSTGYFPTIFKKSNNQINSKRKQTSYYRPISLLEVPGIICEKMLLSRLAAFLSDNSIIKDRQHGFRKLKGTTTAIATAYEKNIKKSSRRKPSVCCTERRSKGI